MASKKKLRARIAELETARRVPRPINFMTLDLQFVGAFFGSPSNISVPIDPDELFMTGRKRLSLPFLLIPEEMAKDGDLTFTLGGHTSRVVRP